MARINKWISIGAAGAILAVLYLYILNRQSELGGLNALLIFLYLWAFFSLVVYVVFQRWIFPRLKNYSLAWRLLWLVACLGAGLWLAHNIPLTYPPPLGPPFSFPGFYKLIFLFSGGFSIGLLLFALSAFFATRSPAQIDSPAPRRWRWLGYALPMLLVWLVYLLAFWPGMMSADSLNQWEQVLSGQFTDHHPAFHTFTIWLLTRIYPSPALVALAQILALGLLAGYILSFYETLGVSTKLLWAASFLFALSPVNGTMVNTLWKDIFYGTAMVGLSFLIFRIANSQGRWIADRWSWVLLGLATALLSLLRQNGWPISLATFFFLLLAYWRQWKPLLAAFLLFTALLFGIRGPLYQLLDVKESAVLLDFSTSFYTIAAHADAGTETEALLESIRPFSKGWECAVVDTLGLVSQKEGLGDAESIGDTTLNLIRRTPGLLMYSYRCRRSLVWMIYDPYGQVLNPSHAQYWIDSNPYGIVPDSRIPYLQENVTEFVEMSSSNPKWNWFVWRPALYLYFFLLVIAVQVLKYKDLRWLLVSMPILVQSVLMSLILIPPNFRYHYAAVLLALLFWPVLFSPGTVAVDQTPSKVASVQVGTSAAP